MATINTIHDLIRLLRENEEWRNAVRRELLMEELLELPQRFAEYAAANDKRWKANDKRWADLDEWRGGVDEWRADVDVWRGGVDRKLDSLQNSVDSLRGNALETRLNQKLIPLVAREFNVKRATPILSPWTVYPTAMFGFDGFMGGIEDAADAGLISDDDETRVRVTDFIMRSLRKSDSSVLWFAVEASGVINDDDITRAKHSADIIAKVYEQDAAALVYGYRISEHQRRLADELGVHVYLDPDSD